MSNGAQPRQKKIAIEVPKDLQAAYANLAFLTHTPAEIILDFAQYLPRMPKGQIVSRVIMSPMHAKLLHAALSQNIAKYEQQFGEIRVPKRTSLADELFRFKPGDEEGDGEE
ncbi:MAG: DUF3467 domain-containing protein [Candidatus Promineifilaceae bacterium]|nr:DUF3467 domain-containing protein [Candidatus Promineifilaceae bacterium]